jgi:hypothetical protein
VENQEKLISLVQKRINGDAYSYIVADKKQERKEILSDVKDKKPSKGENKEILESEKTYKEALAYVKDAISPAFMKVFPNKIQINNTFVKTFFVYSYPNFLE